MGFLLGGAVIYWFTGASTQAVTTGAGRAVEFIKKNINLDPGAEKKASVEKSKAVVKICTVYAQKGMWNIFIAIFSFALAFAFLSSPESGTAPVSLFVSYFILYSYSRHKSRAFMIGNPLRLHPKAQIIVHIILI